MTSRFILVAVLSLSLSGCVFYSPSDGNPNGNAYLGSAGSAYEPAANPPRIMGQVSYNPSAPLPETTQPPIASGAGMAVPNTPRR